MENVAPSSAHDEHSAAHDLHATERATPSQGSPGVVAAHSEQVTGRGRTLLVFALIVLVGVNLRSVILAVPPVLPLIQRDLRLSYTATGLLTSLPLLLMCVFALPAGLLAGRLGGRRTVAMGLSLLAGGALLRGLWPAALPLYLFTVALGAGITLAQTSVPVLARQWFPTRIGLVAALFSDGLILGETLAAAFTLPLMAYFFGAGGWPGVLLLWAVPTALALALWLIFAPPAAATQPARSAAASSSVLPAARQDAPARRRVSALHLGILLGAGSLIYFGMNAWIPPYNQAIGAEDATPLALGVLNAIQLPVGLLVTVFAQRLVGRRWPFVSAGALCLVAILGLVIAPIEWQPFWAACLGGGSSFVFALGIGLPALLFDRSSVARLTGVTLTLSYGVAFLGPLLGGAFWDLAHQPQFAFVPIGLAGLLLIILGAALPSRANFGLLDENAPTT
ncbi:MAG TPA: MFS transporter [Ktedonobacterales bacterium]|jgi:CP family cyanate transporter-like MFS transporter